MRKRLVGLLLAGLAMAGCSTANEAASGNNVVNGVSANVATANAAPSAPLPDADPAMWVVKDEDTTIYLFGTFHLLDGKTDWFNDEVKQAFDQAQEVVFEIPLPANEAEMIQTMAPIMMRYAVDTSGRKLSEELTPEEYRKLVAAFEEIGMPAAAIERFEPWFANMMLQAGVMAKRLGLQGDAGADSVINRAAQARNLPVSGVETLESQIQIFDSMPRAAQVTQLKETLENLDKGMESFAALLRVWNAGDAEGLERLMNEGLDEDPALRRALLENRNRNWAQWIDDRLDRPGVVFMAVGAGHLVGPDSVQTFLRQRNIGSERVPALTP